MAKTCIITQAGRFDTYGRPLLVGQSYTGPDDEVFSLWQTGFAAVNGAPGAFLPVSQIRQQVIAQSGIPFLIMPGDGSANGCQFTGTNGAFTLSAAIQANIAGSISVCYAYFSANFGGSSLPAGWYLTEFSSDTAGIVYAETYTSGTPSRPATKTPIAPSLSGWVTATTTEIAGPSGFLLPGTALGINGFLSCFFKLGGSTAGTKSHRVRANDASSTILAQTGSTTNPMGETLIITTCCGNSTIKNIGRPANSIPTGIGSYTSTMAASQIQTVDTSVDRLLSFSLQGSTNVAAPVMFSGYITATYGE
jgi:hypothetical protein